MFSFSYDLVLPLKPFPGDDNSWEVMIKGCRKENRHRISLSIIQEAWQTMNKRQPSLDTPSCYRSLLLCEEEIYICLKKLHQPLLGVKGRGVIHTLLKLSEEQKSKGVITISTGRFAYILCHHGNMFNIPVTVVMPKTVANSQIGDDYVKKCLNTGSLAKVIRYGNDILEAHNHALYLAQQKGLFYLDGNDHPNMIIGQATLGLQILKEMKNYGVDVVILPTTIDDCGLTAGIAMAIKGKNPKIEIYEVKPTDCDPLVKKIRSQTMSEHELTIRPTHYDWRYYTSILYKKILFDYHIKTNKKAISTAVKILRETEEVSDYYTAIGLAPILDGDTLKKKLKGKRVLIPVFGDMDLATDLSTLRSDLSVPHFFRPFEPGPSTSRE